VIRKGRKSRIFRSKAITRFIFRVNLKFGSDQRETTINVEACQNRLVICFLKV
jgi:hypothetical protein